MKKRIIRIWGICLVVTLLASLFVMSVPASAVEPLQWNTELIPSTTGKVIQTSLSILDMSVNPDGETIYAVGANATDNKRIYKSINGGLTWSDISDATGLPGTMQAEFIACAPDDPDYVVVAQDVTANCTAYVSDDGGIEFANLSFPTAANVNITDIDVSAAAGGKRFVAISGDNGTRGEVWYRNLGLGAWIEGGILDGFNTANTTGHGSAANALAVAFSPNFASDQVLTAVTVNATSNTTFQMMAVSITAATSTWNWAAGFEHYPVVIQDSGTDITATAASIGLSPTYLGGDEVERIAYVGCVAGTTYSGVYRLKDYVDKAIMTGIQIESVAYDGTTLVAGQADDTHVWRCTDPLSSLPTFYPTTTAKKPSGVSNSIVAWLDTSVVAATQGNESAFSVSIDDGKSFNGISLIDTTITTIEDIAAVTDGSYIYFSSDDGADLSVWRYSSDWQRVLSDTGTKNYIVRTAPEDPDVVYVAEYGGKTVYFGKEGGDSKWYSRRSTENIQDLAVESEDVAYIAKLNSKAVIKTTNSGFNWKAAEDTELVSGNIYSILSVSEDNLIVGSSDGYVCYSNDGNDSWDKIEQQIAVAGNLVVAAWAPGGSLADGSYIFAASDTAGSSVYRWPIGQSQAVPWKDLKAYLAPGYSAAYGANSMVMQSDTLYVATCNGTAGPGAVHRIVEPFMPDNMVTIPIMWSSWSSAALAGPLSDLRITTSEENVASDTSLTMWAASGGSLKFYIDLLAKAKATQISPAPEAVTKTNPLTGNAYDVTFSWNHIPYATVYDIHVGIDEGCMEQISATPDTVDALGLPVVSYVVDGDVLTPGTTYYWRIRTSRDGPLTCAWSEVHSFTVESAPAVAPAIGSPANGGTVSSVNPAFSWSPVARASMYEFQLSEDTTFATTLFTKTLAGTGIAPAVTLEAGKTYFWRVRSTEPIVGEWSTIANFSVAEPEAAPAPPVEIVQQAPPEIKVEVPAAEPVPEIILQPPAEEQIAPGYIWAVIIIGAILVIAVIVLIVRTRRQV